MKLRLSSGFVALALSLASVQAQNQVYIANLSGPNESPSNASPGIGFAQIVYFPLFQILTVSANFTGLVGTTTASHIHAATPLPFSGTAGVATTTPTFAGTPLGVTSGSFFVSLDLTQASSFNPAYVTAQGGVPQAAAALIAAIQSGQAYLNIHTTSFPGGEIRGFLVAAPETGSTWSLTSLALGALLIGGYRLRRA